MARRTGKPTAHLVTTAAQSPEQDRRSREKRYLIMMGIRVVAFVIAIVVARGWVRIIAIPLSLILPWIAVVIANAGPNRTPPATPSLMSPRQRRLEGSSSQPRD